MEPCQSNLLSLVSWKEPGEIQPIGVAHVIGGMYIRMEWCCLTCWKRLWKKLVAFSLELKVNKI